MAVDVVARGDLPFPRSLPEFQRLFPDEAACAAYLERARWSDGFIFSRCGTIGEPYRYSARPGVLCCRACRRETRLTAGTVMERTHTPLSVWFWAAYLVACQTPGISAVQLQRQLGLSRYETAFQILHKLRACMVRPTRTRSAASLTNTSRPMRPGLAGVHEERVEAFTTRGAWWLRRSRSVSASPAPCSIREGVAAMRAASGWPWFLTAAPARWAAS